jgi:transposase
MTQITLRTGPERRRRWSAAEQREIMAAAFVPGAVVAEVARRFEVSTSMIYKWRREALACRSEAAFVPAVVVPEPLCVSRAPMGPSIVIDLAGGTRLTIDAQASVGLVGAVLRALR